MESEKPYFYKEIRPVILYLNDLRYLEGKLCETEWVGEIIIFYNEELQIKDVETLREWSKTFGVDKLDYLILSYADYTVSFFPRKTIVCFNRDDIDSYLLEETVYPFLLQKQNVSLSAKQKIFLYDKPRQRSFWLQDKTPLWLSVLLALIPIIISIIALLK